MIARPPYCLARPPEELAGGIGSRGRSLPVSSLERTAASPADGAPGGAGAGAGGGGGGAGGAPARAAPPGAGAAGGGGGRGGGGGAAGGARAAGGGGGGGGAGEGPGLRPPAAPSEQRAGRGAQGQHG